MVVDIGDKTNYDGYFSDNVTPDNGNYAWYFKTMGTVPEEDEAYPLYPSSELVSPSFSHISIQNGMRIIVWRITAAKLTQGANYDNLKKAMAYWTINKTLLFHQFKNEDGTNIAKIYNSSITQVDMRVKILRLKKRLVKGAGLYSCIIIVGEFTS